MKKSFLTAVVHVENKTPSFPCSSEAGNPLTNVHTDSPLPDRGAAFRRVGPLATGRQGSRNHRQV